jgi:hypothetical protein
MKLTFGGRISNTMFFPYDKNVLQNVQSYLHGYDKTIALTRVVNTEVKFIRKLI